MKNTPVSILAWVCIILAAFLTGMFIGRNLTGGTIQTSVLTTSASAQGSSVPASLPATSSTSPATTQGNGKVNINTADLYTLMTLEGIGEIYAQRIIDYRNANGPFSDITELKNVEGIGEKRFDAIKDKITTRG